MREADYLDGADRMVCKFWLQPRHTVAAGGDTDTLGAIVGGIVAARVGADAIPARWREAVEALPVAFE